MSVCVDYYYFVLELFSLIGIYYVSLCGLLLFCFGTVQSNSYLICQSVDYFYFVLVLFPLIGM